MGTIEGPGVVIAPPYGQRTKLHSDIHVEIIKQFADSYSSDCINGLKILALVCREWRATAQRLIHQQVEIDARTYQMKLMKYSPCNGMANTLAVPFDGEIWRHPRSLILHAPPDAFSSWLQVPEFLAFVGWCGGKITDIRMEQQFTRLANALQYIFLFPFLKQVSVRDGEATKYISRPVEQLPPRQLQDVSIEHYNECNASSGCFLRDFAEWLRITPTSNIRVSLHLTFQFRKARDSVCNALVFVAAGVQELTLEVQRLHDPRMDPFEVYRNSAYLNAAFPNLSLCTRLKELSFHNYASSIPEYALFTLSSVTSKVLTSITFMTDVEKADDIGPDSFPGLVGLGDLLSKTNQFPALRRIEFTFWICSGDDEFAERRDLIKGLLLEEFGSLMRGRKEVNVVFEFRQEPASEGDSESDYMELSS